MRTDPLAMNWVLCLYVARVHLLQVLLGAIRSFTNMLWDRCAQQQQL